MYSSTPSHPFDYSTSDGNAQAGPSSRSFSPHPGNMAPTPAYNPYLSSSFTGGSHEGSTHGEGSVTPDWRQSSHFQPEASSSRRSSGQMMNWSSQSQGRVDAYPSNQWESSYTAGQNYGRQGDGYAMTQEVTAGPSRRGPLDERRGTVDDRRAEGSGSIEDDDRRKILLLSQTLTELISLLAPYRPTPSTPHPNPPPHLLPRLAELARTVDSILHHLSPRFRLNSVPGSRPPSPRRSKLKDKDRGRSRSSLPRPEAREMTSPEREMEAIRKRRDALIQRAKDGLNRAPDRPVLTGEVMQLDSRDTGGGEREGYPVEPFVQPSAQDYNPPPDYAGIQQQHLHDLGTNIGVGNYDNRASFITTPYSDISRSFSDGLMFGPPPDTLDNTPSHSSFNFDIDPLLPGGHIASGFGSLDHHFAMPPPPPPPPMANFDYGLRHENGGDASGVAEDGTRQDHRQRCHGCGTVVQGKWMRGPDGPDSLCVSCGLHYAKLNKRRAGEVADTGGGLDVWGALPVVAGPV